MLVAMQHFFGKAGELRKKHRAKEPHPADAQQRSKHHHIAMRQLEIAPCLGNGIPVDDQTRIGGRCVGDELRADATHHGQGHAGYGHLHMPHFRHSNQQATSDLPQQDGDESAHLHHAIAAGQLTVVQHLRQIGKFDGAKQRGVQAHEKDTQQQDGHIRFDKTPGRDQHDADLQVLDQAEHARLVPLVGQLPRGGRKQQVRQREQRTNHQPRHGGRQPGDTELVRHHHRESELEQIVIARTSKLRPEKRRKAALAQQGKLIGVGLCLCE